MGWWSSSGGGGGGSGGALGGWHGEHLGTSPRFATVPATTEMPIGKTGETDPFDDIYSYGDSGVIYDAATGLWELAIPGTYAINVSFYSQGLAGSSSAAQYISDYKSYGACYGFGYTDNTGAGFTVATSCMDTDYIVYGTVISRVPQGTGDTTSFLEMYFYNSHPTLALRLTTFVLDIVRLS